MFNQEWPVGKSESSRTTSIFMAYCSFPNAVKFVVGLGSDISVLVDDTSFYHRRQKSGQLSQAMMVSRMGIYPILKYKHSHASPSQAGFLSCEEFFLLLQIKDQPVNYPQRNETL